MKGEIMLSKNHKQYAFAAYVLSQSDKDAHDILALQAALRSELVELQRDLANLESLYCRSRREAQSMSRKRMRIMQLTGKLQKLEEEMHALPSAEEYRRQYDAICAIPRVADVTIESALVITTDPLFGRDKRGIWRRVGPYRITFNAHQHAEAISERISWINIEGGKDRLTENPLDGTRVIMTSFGADASGRRVCLGTARDPLVGAYQRNDYVTLVSILVRFPECQGQFNDLELWPVANIEEVPIWYREMFGW